ncbi:hypothetical protein [Corynebacterium striatum]|uniref:hypothetical protein n=1 Tax=Corynebacterium striatum TaxID=43770 RepID=UPI000668A754|nr:hypothetical protein [Corynebacterium striatum]HAT1504282.1 hypothetical protein [Corynebacterium striatum]HAT1506842.1 hypothetical protein [Corynebacterium striatum]
MSNPTFRSGPITFEAAAKLEKFRLVTVADGKVKHAAATGGVFGAVTEKADPKNNALPTNIAVHIGPAAVKLEVDGGEAKAIKAGAAVFAAADGKVAATGTVQVGVAAWDGEGDSVLTVLNLPVANG